MTDSALTKKQLRNQRYYEKNKDRIIKNVIARKNDKRQETTETTPDKSLEISTPTTISTITTPLRKNTSHFQTTHRPIHINPTGEFQLDQPTPPSTPYESRTLTITVKKRKKKPTPAPVKYNHETVIKLIDDLDVTDSKKSQVKARTITLFNMTNSPDLLISLKKTG